MRIHSRHALRWALAGVFGLVLGGFGCAVPQAPGKGKVLHRIEGTTGMGYWLYLPEEYVKNDGERPNGARWPLVVTFHGMKPYDNANPQIREWGQEADRYNLIVCAPELQTCDSFMQFPLRDATLPYVQRDERGTIAMMDEIFRTTQADPTRVLSTSWSSGGYMAHFMVNRYPERFTCVAVRQSNFSEAMLDPQQVPKYRDMKVGIFFGENDFNVCRKESTRAVEWYREHRFDVSAKYVRGLGHERTPQTAAMFFARVHDLKPNSPPPLGALVMEDVMPVGRPTMPSRAGAGTPTVVASRDRARPRTRLPRRTNPVFPGEMARSEGDGTVQATEAPRVARVSATAPPRYSVRHEPAPRVPRRTPARSAPLRSGHRATEAGARIRLSTTVGVTPLWVNYRVELPDDLKRGASILWTDNGRPISTAPSGYCVMREVGNHKLEALIITRGDREIRLVETVKVLPKLATSRPVADTVPGGASGDVE